VHISAHYTCNLGITIYYNSCGCGFLKHPHAVVAMYLSVTFSLMQMKWHTFCQNKQHLDTKKRCL